jgi:hypothetical protein
VGAHFSIDVTELHMFAGETWRDFGDPCPHDCPHNGISVIGWGPTTATYELVECSLCDCRAWHDGRGEQERQRSSGMDGFWRTNIDWHVPVG